MAKLKKTINNEYIGNASKAGSSFFTGVDNEVDRWLDPFVSGYAFIYWVKVPDWFEQDDDLKHFKRLSQVNFRSFNGVSSIDLQTSTLNTGFANHEMDVVTGISRQNTEFQIGHKEYSGGVMRKMYQKWISLIRDPRTGIALYPKLYGVDYSSRNHSAQLLYIVVRPDVNNTKKDIVEYAAFYSNVIPTNIPLDSLYNFEIGSQESPVIDINFKGFPEIGPDVEAYAKTVLEEKIFTDKADGYIPFIDSVGAHKVYDEGSVAVEWESEVLKSLHGENK